MGGGKGGFSEILLKMPRCDIDGVREVCVGWSERERRWVVSKRPRCDTNGGSETVVIVTSKRHAQAVIKQKEQRDRKEKAASIGGAVRDPGERWVTERDVGLY